MGKKIANEIYHLNPNVKLIWLFREPIQRLISQYNHNVASGLENKKLSKALELEPIRIKYNLQLGYKFGSNYINHINRYLQFFPIENMLFLSFEELISNPLKITNESLAFLQKDALNSINHEVKNKTHMPKFPFLLYYTRKLWGRGTRPFNLAYRINYYTCSPSNKKTYLPSKWKYKLDKEFKHQIQELNEVTGKNFSEIWYHHHSR